MNPNKRNYRATFILDTRGVEETVEQIIENMKQEIAVVEGEVSAVENLGQRDFARVTNPKRPTGVYVQFDFTGPSTAPAALKERVRLNNVIYRTYIETL